MSTTMGKTKEPMSTLFPTVGSMIIFALYVLLFINQGILVKATQKDHKYKYNTVAVVLLTECTKLIIATGIYLKDHKVKDMITIMKSNPRLFLLYFIPSLMYALYNNLSFTSLTHFDPTTYYILLQFRMVVTGVVYQIIFKRRLSRMQWLSLILITLGCLVKNMSSFLNPIETDDLKGGLSMSTFLTPAIGIIGVQIFCSCFAGVYTEFLVKDSSDVHLMIQNVFMYMDSIIVNLSGLLLLGVSSTGDSATFISDPLGTFATIFMDPLIFFVMFNSALCGIITSMFLKSFNSILKIFASALELIITALLCFLFFHIPIDVFTVAAIALVSLATYIYSQNPLKTVPPPAEKPFKDVKYSPVEGDAQC